MSTWRDGHLSNRNFNIPRFRANLWHLTTFCACSRALTDTEQHYTRVEKEVKAVEGSILTNQIYLYRLRDKFRVKTDHKPLVPLLSGYQMRTALHIERMRVSLQRFDFHLNYIPGKSTVMKRNEMVTQDTPSQESQSNTERKRRKWWRSRTGEEFKKGIMAVVQESLPKAVTMHKLKSRLGGPFTSQGTPRYNQNKRIPPFKTAASRSRQNGGNTHITMPSIPGSYYLTRQRITP